MTVGGARNVEGLYARQSAPGVLGPPRPIRAGLFNEYVRVSINGEHLVAEAHAFNANGSYIGVLDRFEIPATP